MRTTLRLLLACCLAGSGLRAADDDPKAAIKAIIAANLIAVRDARTAADLVRAVDAVDVPEWRSELPNGQVLTRADALKGLQGLLAIPPKDRPLPNIDYIQWGETPGKVVVLYWVYSERDRNVFGSMARDTWTRTPGGWRRTLHEKLFTDRPLLTDGKAVILPQVH